MELSDKKVAELMRLSHGERLVALASDPQLLTDVLATAAKSARRSARMVDVVCQHCDRVHQVERRRQMKARFCSWECTSAHRAAHPVPATTRLTPEKFWARVDKLSSPDGCWPWRGTKQSGGYGSVNYKGKRVVASRYAYESHTGQAIPAGLVVRHKFCCRPDHLELGTTADNQRDKAIRGRAARGSRHAQARLTESQVAIIKAEYRPRHPQFSTPALARRFGVSRGSIDAIIRGTNWRHVAPAGAAATATH
jgi:hypothetical protein